MKNSGLVVAAPAEREITLLKADGSKQVVAPAVPRLAMPVTYGDATYELGFFCRKEIQLENTIHLPLRLRLGSLQEVNRLEGKPGW
ncbi:MAG TPA: hypothetical protein VFE32_19895 [Puia sp.]|nr:hypothetical protein [Puia sp.]